MPAGVFVYRGTAAHLFETREELLYRNRLIETGLPGGTATGGGAHDPEISSDVSAVCILPDDGRRAMRKNTCRNREPGEQICLIDRTKRKRISSRCARVGAMSDHERSREASFMCVTVG